VKKTAPLILLFAAACTSSVGVVDDIDVTAAATSQTSGTTGSVAFFDEAANTITISVNGVANNALTADSSLDFRSFDGYSSTTFPESYYGYRAVSASGGSEVILAGGEGVGRQAFVAHIARLDETVVPTAGDVTYTGEYLALLTQGGSQEATQAIVGNVALTASFDTAQTSGEITNRTTGIFSDINATSFDNQADVTFDVGSLTDAGAFSGTTAEATYIVPGGTRAGTYTGTGTYAGLITGATGDEAVGTVVIDYEQVSGFNTTYKETGVFILNAEDP